MAFKTVKAKSSKLQTVNELGIDPRDLTVQQRLELFSKKKAELSKDWRVVKENEDEELVPFNSLTLDHGLRLYGMARNGTVYQFHGDEGAGKSTLAYAVNREYQKITQEPVAIFDFERTTKSWYLRAMGIDESRAFVKRPDSIEDAVKNAIDLMGQGVRLFTFDSIPRMRSKVEVGEIKNGNAFKVQPGTHARAIQQFYDIMLPHIAAVDGTLLMINQTRSRIEMTQEAKSAASGYATVTNLDYSLPGGRANRYAISAMVELKTIKAWRPGKIEDPFIIEAEAQRGEEYLANEVRVRTLKNKVSGTGYREGRIWIRPGLGTDENISIRQWGRDLKMIANHGKRYFVGNSIDDAIKVYDTKELAIEDLVNNPNEGVLNQLKEAIIERMYADNSIGALQVDEDASRYLAGESDFAADNDNHIPASLIPEAADDEL
jgi:RecA/RadA recombinase